MCECLHIGYTMHNEECHSIIFVFYLSMFKQHDAILFIFLQTGVESHEGGVIMAYAYAWHRLCTLCLMQS